MRIFNVYIQELSTQKRHQHWVYRKISRSINSESLRGQTFPFPELLMQKMSDIKMLILLFFFFPLTLFPFHSGGKLLSENHIFRSGTKISINLKSFHTLSQNCAFSNFFKTFLILEVFFNPSDFMIPWFELNVVTHWSLLPRSFPWLSQGKGNYSFYPLSLAWDPQWKMLQKCYIFII